MCIPSIRLPEKKKLLQRNAERGQGVMNQLNADVQGKQAAEEGNPVGLKRS